MVMEQAKRQSEHVTGISNVAYDLMSVLHNKLDGIAAIEGYKKDAQEKGDQEVNAMFDQLMQTERADVERLRGLLAQRL